MQVRYIKAGDSEKTDRTWEKIINYKPAPTPTAVEALVPTPKLPAVPRPPTASKSSPPQKKDEASIKNTTNTASKASGVKRGLQVVKNEPQEEDVKAPKVSDHKQEERTMKALIGQLQQVYIQANEIKTAVQNEEDWKWLSLLPQWEAFNKTY